MAGHHPIIRGASLLIVALLAGCTPQQPFYFHQNLTTTFPTTLAWPRRSTPDVKECPLGRGRRGDAAPVAGQSDAKEIWDLKLEDAVRFTLENSKVIRSLVAVSSPHPSFPHGAVTGPPSS